MTATFTFQKERYKIILFKIIKKKKIKKNSLMNFFSKWSQYLNKHGGRVWAGIWLLLQVFNFIAISESTCELENII